MIGRKRFLYDLWGDAVNTASRMESHGAPGRIQITRATYELLAGEFECEPRGTIAVKGKGEIEAWYLVGSKGDAARNDLRRGAGRERVLELLAIVVGLVETWSGCGASWCSVTFPPRRR